MYVKIATVLGCLTIAAAAVSATQNGEKDGTEKGQVKIGTHVVKLEAGQLYQFKVDANGFRPQVNLRSGYFINQMTLNRGDTFEGLFVPRESKEFRVVIGPDLYDDELGSEPLNYTFSVKKIPLSEKPALKEQANLTNTDPLYMNKEAFTQKDVRYKRYPVKMKGRQYYIIDMARGADELDPLLLLEDSEGKVLASDQGSGANGNARIVYSPRRDGEYRIIATTARPAVGPFTLTVRGQE